MRNNIKIIFVILLSFVAISCVKKDEYKLMTVIGLTQESYGIDIDNIATLTVLANSPINGDVSFSISIDLKEGEDYELINKTFAFRDTTIAQVKIKFLKEIPQETILDISLLPIDFGTLALAKAKVGLNLDEDVIYTFDYPAYEVSEITEITVSLSTVNGVFKNEMPVTLEVEVDDKRSTAKEGVHFSFPEGKTITIEKRKSKGTLKVKLLKEELGKNNFVLRLKNLPKAFHPGNIDEAKVSLLSTTFERLTGSWKYVAFTTYDYLDLNTSWADDPSKLPVNNTAADVLTFDHNELTVSLSGDMKNYFRNTELVKKADVVQMLIEAPGFPPPRVNVMVAEGKANVPFSPNKEAVRNAQIGFRITTINGKEYLEVTIGDFEPVDFLQNTYDMVKDWGSNPVMVDYPIRYRFERVK
ncbi:MAG: DUF4843 domain-containing protein [Sphingobacterium sp.]|jgi:hypothetical protein|nr:DUF4843 domain-containing protein [Sphingobacterium sp.]